MPAAEKRAPEAGRVSPKNTYDRIVIVGGGCYGSYYLRQLTRAREAGVISWDKVTVVDRDPACAARSSDEARDATVEFVTAEWAAFFSEYLDGLAVVPEINDGIV